MITSNVTLVGISSSVPWIKLAWSLKNRSRVFSIILAEASTYHTVQEEFCLMSFSRSHPVPPPRINTFAFGGTWSKNQVCETTMLLPKISRAKKSYIGAKKSKPDFAFTKENIKRGRGRYSHQSNEIDHSIQIVYVEWKQLLRQNSLRIWWAPDK